MIEHFGKDGLRPFVKLILGGFSRGGQRIQYAAARLQYLKIPGAAELQGHLMLTPAAENEVGMRIYKTGGDELAPCVQHVFALGRFGIRAYPLDGIPVYEHGAVGNKLHARVLRAPAEGLIPLRSSQNAYVFYQQHSHQSM